MSIRREDLDAGRIDFGDIVTGERIPPAHPGRILREEFLEPMTLSVYALAKATKATHYAAGGGSGGGSIGGAGGGMGGSLWGGGS